jgi:aspartate aminotransferase
MSRKSREMKEQGIDVISLSLGEPDFSTPDFIKDAAKEGIDQNFTYYPPIPGYKDLRDAICAKFKRDNNLSFEADQIVVSTGAKQSIANAVLCTINPGDEVLLPAPYWVSYYEIVRLAGGVPIVIPTSIETDFKLSAEALSKHITDKTKMLIYSSPCNPSGSVYTHEELEGLAKVIAKHKNLLVIADEIYELINFVGKHHSLASFEEIKEQVITINGVSKGFSMTGWRLGYLAASKEIAQACTKMQGQFTSATSGITQRAALAAMKADPAEVSYMKDAFLKRRDLVLKHLKGIEGFEANTPKGAFYVFPKVTSLFGKHYGDYHINNSSDLCMYLLEEAHVALVSGDAFGSPNCLRISYATSEETLTEAFTRIAEAVTKLN